MTIIQRYYLKTGLAIAIIFPAIFVFDKAGKDPAQTILFFLTFFFFILSLWMYNAAFVDFKRLLSCLQYRRWNSVYRNIVISLLLSIPLYFVLGVAFRQEHILFASIFESSFSPKAWFYIILRIVLFDAGLLICKFIIDNNKEKQRFKIENEVLKTEQWKATHESFKQQVDPHFLFNSLNTLQSLVKQQDTESTIQFIRELSQVYRYMLVRRDRDYVSIGEEVEFLKSYLYLLKIRFGDAFHTVIDIHENHVSTKMPVHTLQLLAENAVKHNMVTKRDPLLLEIKSEGDALTVKNNILPKQQHSESSGIGLHNINKRYQLLFGRKIAIANNDGYFRIMLPIIK